jgi:hypothetical protein
VTSPELDKKAKKAEKKSDTRLLDPWERYRALVDLLDSQVELACWRTARRGSRSRTGQPPYRPIFPNMFSAVPLEVPSSSREERVSQQVNAMPAVPGFRITFQSRRGPPPSTPPV